MSDVLSTRGTKGTPKLYGRKWRVSVLVPDNPDAVNPTYKAYVLSDSDREETSLRVTFNIQKHGYIAVNYSEISIYNMSPRTEEIVSKNGMRVMVEAGYVKGAFGVIHVAPIFQPLWEMEDNVTYKVTFRCVDGRGLVYNNHVSLAETPMRHQKDMVLAMAKAARRPFDVKSMSADLINNQLPRPKIFFDEPIYYLRKYAQQNGTLPSVIDLDAYIEKAQGAVSTSAVENALVLSPGEGGLVNVPQQTQDGITFQCLLNPMITVFPVGDDEKPRCQMIKIKNSFIRQMALTPNQDRYPNLDRDGVYKVIGVSHMGDTRGSSWYTQVVAVDQSMMGTMGAMWQTANDVVE